MRSLTGCWWFSWEVLLLQMGEFSWYLLKRCQNTQEPFQTQKQICHLLYLLLFRSWGIYDLSSPSSPVSHTRKDSWCKESCWRWFLDPAQGIVLWTRQSQVTQKPHFCHCRVGWKKGCFPSHISPSEGVNWANSVPKKKKTLFPSALQAPALMCLSHHLILNLCNPRDLSGRRWEQWYLM